MVPVETYKSIVKFVGEYTYFDIIVNQVKTLLPEAFASSRTNSEKI